MSPPPSNSFVAGSVSTNDPNGLNVNTVGTTTTYNLTNRFNGTASTSNASPTNILVVAPTIPDAVYTIQATFSGIRTAAPQGAVGYNIFATVRTDGSTCTLVGTPDKIVNEDDGTGGSTDMTGCDANILVAANTIQFEVVGIVGSTINWNMVATYTEAS